MGLEFGYGLGRCYAPKTTQLVGRPPLCVAMLYLIKEFIKRALIFNLNIHHVFKEIHTQHIKDHKIKENESNIIKQNKLNMECWQLNKTHKEKISNKPNMEKRLKQTWKIIKHKYLT